MPTEAEISKFKLRWETMREGTSSPIPLPGRRGSYVLLLPGDVLQLSTQYPEGRYVHFFWDEGTFRVRDFIENCYADQSNGLTPSMIWERAIDRKPCRGELRKSVGDYPFWRSKLESLTESYYKKNTRLTT